MESFMKIHLVVVHPFGSYAKGEAIMDAATVSQVLAGEYRNNVVRVVTQGV
jgi:hypothetical protein